MKTYLNTIFFAPFSNYFIARHFNVLHLLPFKVGNYARNFNRGRSREGALGAETPSLKINVMFCRYLLVASFPSLPLPPPLVSVEKSQVATHRLFTKNLGVPLYFLVDNSCRIVANSILIVKCWTA